MAVGLKERTRADAVCRPLRLISQMRGADSNENLLRPCLAIAGIGLAECYDSANLGQGGVEFLRPDAHGRSAGLTRARDVYQQLSVVRVGEELDLAHSFGNFARPSALPQARNGAVDQRRTDRTLFHRQQFVRRQFEISRGECRADLHLQTRPVAIVPRRRRMDLDVKWQVELGRAPQALAQDFFLDLKLMLVAGVLVVTTAAAGKVLAARLDAVRRRLED